MNNELSINSNLPVTSEDMLINILKTQKEEKMKVQDLTEYYVDHERRIVEIETNRPINATLNNYLTRVRNRIIVDFLGGKSSKAYKYVYPEGSGEHYKKLTNKVYAEAEREFKTKFDIRVYGELRQHQYEDAIIFWEEYEPSKEVLNEINQVNNQINLFD